MTSYLQSKSNIYHTKSLLMHSYGYEIIVPSLLEVCLGMYKCIGFNELRPQRLRYEV